VLLTSYGSASRLVLHHADLYRLDCPGDELEMELEELPGPRGVLAIEWAERLSAFPWRRRLHVRLEHLGEDRRRVAWEFQADADVTADEAATEGEVR
jgi:tRNA A37 threonylcarbamoyladenosine biosynthesis protein TsaE